MKINKSILILLLIVFFTFENNICLSQSYDYYKGISQDNNYTQVYPLIELIKNNISQNDFKSAKNNFNELIKQVENTPLSLEDKLKYFDILNVITRRYCHSEQNASKRQTAVLEIKNTYKELYLKDLRFQESYINSIQSFISVNDRSNVALYGILDLIVFGKIEIQQMANKNTAVK